MKQINNFLDKVAMLAFLVIGLSGCGGGGGRSWLEQGAPPTVSVSSSARLVRGDTFAGGPVEITLRVDGENDISSPLALITPTAGGVSVTVPLSVGSSGTCVGTYNVPPNLSNKKIDKHYDVIVSAFASGSAVSSMCQFTVPAADPLPPTGP